MVAGLALVFIDLEESCATLSHTFAILQHAVRILTAGAYCRVGWITGGTLCSTHHWLALSTTLAGGGDPGSAGGTLLTRVGVTLHLAVIAGTALTWTTLPRLTMFMSRTFIRALGKGHTSATAFSRVQKLFFILTTLDFLTLCKAATFLSIATDAEFTAGDIPHISLVVVGNALLAHRSVLWYTLRTAAVPSPPQLFRRLALSVLLTTRLLATHQFASLTQTVGAPVPLPALPILE